MSAGFPCPNPTCTQVFPPDAVKGTASLACPACGTVYQFRNPAAPKPKSIPAQKAAPPPPVARLAGKGPPPLPVAPIAPVADLAAPDRRDRRPDPRRKVGSSPDTLLSAPKRRRGRGNGLKIVVCLALVLGLGGALAYGIYWVSGRVPSGEPEDDTNPRTQKAEGNFSFTAPPGWKQDKAVQVKFKRTVNLAMKRKNQGSYMALAYRDYKTRTPSDAELLDEALKQIRAYFPSVEYENPFTGKEKGRTGKLDGEPAVVVPFQATDKEEVMMRGEVYMLTRQGYAYWLITWGPEEYLDQISPGWAALRDQFKLHDQRDGWRPRPRESEPFVSPESGFRLNYVKGLWIKEDNPKSYDEKCELALKGFEPTLDPDTGKKQVIAYAGKLATVRVLVLPPAADAKAAHAAALEHVEKKEKQTFENFKVEPVADRKTGKPIVGVEVGAFRGQVSRLKFELGPGAERYAVLAVVPLAKATLAVLCDCPFDRRDFWELEFLALIETVRRAKG